jgi:hypothetical protein
MRPGLRRIHPKPLRSAWRADPMIEQTAYRGWANTWRVSNGTVELIVLADVGPRVIRYGFCGDENILHEVGREAGLSGGSDFRLYGGHRLWVWPEVARTYFPDNRPVEVTTFGDTVRFTSLLEDFAPGTHLQKRMEISLDPEGTRVCIEHTITNQATEPTELAVWCPTMMRAGGCAILPLPPRIAMDPEHYQSVGVMALWSFTDLADPRWALGTEFIALHQQAKPEGRFAEQMSGIWNPAGWGAYHSDDTLFVKRAAPIRGARYPDFGCNFEIFTNSDFLELESLSPIVTLKPKESASHAETWALFRDVRSGTGEDWIRSQVAFRAESVSLLE